ncbi:MAG: YXWGXW repeat-containing protein [Planctomycetes bacterium]|nr:YXWGXW repeat-containing protein [Planctomycetota bacterium]
MRYYRFALALIGMAIFIVCGQWPGQAAAQVDIDVGGLHIQIGDRPPPPPPPAMEVEVLTRGPIHEAFAQPVIFDEGAGFVITRRPPAPLDEIVPDERPQGNHIVWIPGYWSWDTDRNDFIWVSGCWRAVPPNNSWVPGYWAEARGGYQWIAGFWTAADTEEIEYLPAPPATLEQGPQGTDYPDSIWIPGCWVRHQGRYAWRPGFWEQARPNWVWVPAHYVYSPRGWVYVDGYWDYPLDRRGVAFLPVYCSPRLYGRADFRYSPEIVLDLGILTLELFSSPQRHHYYFGDYYGPEYSREGFHPWYEARDRHGWYDPIYVHQQWQHRDDRRWVDNQRTQYERRRDDQSLRPARTYEAMRAQTARLPEQERRQAQVARPMKEIVSERTTPFKFDRLDAKTREAEASRAKDARAYQEKRAHWESPPAAPRTGPEPRAVVTPREPARTPPQELPRPPTREVTPPERPQAADHGATVREPPARQDVQPQRVKIPRPPVAVREPVREKELTPPPKPKQPNPDPDARPKHTQDAPGRSQDAPGHSKDNDNSDKDKPDSTRK